jgi:hypothetical protein
MKNLTTFKLHAASTQAPALRPSRPAQDAPVNASEPEARGGARRLLLLLALDAVATLAAVEATGAIHNSFARMATVAIALTLAAGILAALAVALNRRRPASAPAPAPAVTAGKKPFGLTKAMLMLMMAVGIAAYFGGAGTFAGFTAETSNPNDSLSSGTLTFSNTVNSNTACTSINGASANNVNAGCDSMFALTNVAPGVFGGTAKITLQNTGSLNASKLYLWAPYASGVLQTGIANGATVNSLTLSTTGGPNGMEGTVSNGDLVVVSAGSKTQTFKVGANASPGATTLTIVNDATYPNVATAAFAAGATVQDTSSDTSVDNTNCYDVQTTSSPVAGATYGTQLNNFNPILHNPFCQAALIYVQEIGTNHNYCWIGNGSGSANGMCNAPISTNPTIGSNTTIGTATYTVAALTGNVKTGDSVAFTEGANVVTCTATASSYITATAISVNSCSVTSGVNGTFDSSTVVTDTTTLTTLSTDTTNTISNFDTTKKYTSKVELTPVSANGTTAATGTDLPHYDGGSTDTRKFYVGVYVPSTAASQNQLQGLKSTFGITWHIDQ